MLRLTGRKILLQPVDRWRFVVLALLAIPGNQLLYITGINTSLASHAALLYGTTPAWVLLIAVGLGMERVRGWKVSGIILSISGVVIVLLGGGMVRRRSQHKDGQTEVHELFGHMHGVAPSRDRPRSDYRIILNDAGRRAVDERPNTVGPAPIQF